MLKESNWPAIREALSWAGIVLCFTFVIFFILWAIAQAEAGTTCIKIGNVLSCNDETGGNPKTCQMIGNVLVCN